jgi:hypothetical protein
MNDAERDAWLREALRHAPDSGALPPSALSEAILASARVATRSTPGLPARRAPHTGPKHPLAAFWDWLARPPVAAGFASVLAATLVGLMWWDRPMDEMLARRPALAREDAAAAAPRAIVRPLEGPAPSNAWTAERSAAAPVLPVAPQVAPTNDAAAAVPRDATDARRQRPSVSSDQGGARDAKVAPSRNAAEELKAREDAPLPAARQQVESKREAPTAFPPGDLPRSAPATPALPDAPKKDNDRSEPVPREDAAAPASTSRAAAANRTEAAQATIDTGQPALRQGALDGANAKEARAFASASAAGPLAPLLSAIGADAAQWSRLSATGTIVTLDPGWRDWLLQLDAATAGRWSATGARGGATEGERARDGAPTLCLIARDRSTMVVRLDGSTASVEGAAGERWQAALAPEVADRLRASAARLAR